MPSATTPEPYVQYMPDYEQYKARGERRQKSENLDKTLPDGFPQKLTGDLVWDADTVSKDFAWNYQLTASDLTEINNALSHFKCKLPGAVSVA